MTPVVMIGTHVSCYTLKVPATAAAKVVTVENSITMSMAVVSTFHILMVTAEDVTVPTVAAAVPFKVVTVAPLLTWGVPVEVAARVGM